MKRSTILSLTGAVLVLGIGLLVVPGFMRARDARSELLSQQERWEAAEIESYRYVASISCLCAGPNEWAVEVTGNEVSILPADSDEHFGREDVPTHVVGSDQLFSLAGSVIGDDEYEIEYDDETGLPTRIYGDPDSATSDDTLLVRITDIETLELNAGRVGLGPRDRWAEAGVDNYRYVVEYHCECSTPFLWAVEVRDGSVVELEPIDAMEEHDDADLPWELAGAGNLFAWVEGMSADESAFVDYDDVTGFPLHIASDPSAPHLVVREFEILAR